MTRTMYKIRNYISGNELRITRTIDNVPADSALDRVRLTIKSDRGGSDASADLTKTVTTTPTTDGQITDDGSSDQVGEVEFDLSEQETLDLGSEVTYHYDIQAWTDSDKLGTVEIGTIRFIPRVADAIS